MFPPGKNSGRTTNVSVVNASRRPPPSVDAPPRRSASRCGRPLRTRGGSGARSAPPRACRRRRGPSRRGHGRAAAPGRSSRRCRSPVGRQPWPHRGTRRHPGAGTGSTRRTRPRSRPSARRAACAACTPRPKHSHSLGLIRPWSTSPARQRVGSSTDSSLKAEPPARVELGVRLGQPPAALRDHADAAPLAVADVEHLLEHRAGRQVALGAHGALVRVLDLGTAGLELDRRSGGSPRARRAARSR